MTVTVAAVISIYQDRTTGIRRAKVATETLGKESGGRKDRICLG